METRELKNGYKAVIDYDQCPENPRNWMQFGTIVTGHRRYQLGDKNIKDYVPSYGVFGWDSAMTHYFNYEFSIIEIDEENGRYFHDINEGLLNNDGMKKVDKWIERNIIWLPLYLFDHSGLALLTGSGMFAAADPMGWDWGKVGFIYITKDKVKELYGWKKLTKKRERFVEKMLDEEVKSYGKYINGEMYSLVIKDEKGNCVENIGGLIGLKEVEREIELFEEGA